MNWLGGSVKYISYKWATVKAIWKNTHLLKMDKETKFFRFLSKFFKFLHLTHYKTLTNIWVTVFLYHKFKQIYSEITDH